MSDHLTTGSNRSLRSLGRAKARPLTKRYAQGGNMRKFNIFLMLGAAIIAFLAIFPPLVKTRNMAYLAKITSSLLAIIVIPLGCAVRLINSNVKSAKAQTEISISYIATLVATTTISSSVGSTPYLMRSMNTGLH